VTSPGVIQPNIVVMCRIHSTSSARSLPVHLWQSHSAMGAFAAATELVPIPAEGRRYSATSTVRLGDVDQRGQLRFDGLARRLQDVANDDAVDSGLVNAVWWVVRRTLVAVRQVPVFGEQLTLTTFCSGTGRSWAERRTSIDGDRGGSVEVVSLWVQLDPVTERISALGDEFHRIYGVAAGGRRVSARLSLPALPIGTEHRPWAIRAVDVDILGHVNNAALWAILEETLVNAESRSGVAEIEYLAPIDAADSPATLHTAGTHERLAWLLAHDTLCTVARWRPTLDGQDGAALESLGAELPDS
jgi:acyl-ACP thioesterase